MGRIIATEFVSLDGVVEAPGGGEDFEYAGWSFEIERGEEGTKFKLDETSESDALLLGRKTYEGFAAAWPSREGETVGTPEWSNTTVLRGDLAQEVGRLRERHGGPIVVHGSPTLVQGLLEHDLLDELRLMVYPVVLGKGKRLFGSTTTKKRMRLRSSRLVGDGVEILIYEAVRTLGGGVHVHK